MINILLPDAEVSAADWEAAESILGELLHNAWHPGAAQRIDDWTETNISLPSQEGLYSGQYRFANTPYARGALILMAHSRYRHILLNWGAQTGKSLTIMIYCGYMIDQRPARVMYVSPDKKFAKIKSRSHMQPFILENEVLRKHLTGRPDDMQNFEMRLDRMAMTYGWAGSPSTLAGESVQVIVMDESGKYKQRDKDEGNPRQLALRRMIAFGDLGQAVEVTTPSTVSHESWKAFLDSSMHRRWVPCPHCGRPDLVADLADPIGDCDVPATKARLEAAGYQVLEFSQIKGFSGLRRPEEIRKAAYYECRHCKKPIEHSSVRDMDARGIWVPDVSGCDIAGLHLPSWYRCITTMSWGRVAERFIAAQGDPEKLQEWKTHDCAEAWEEMGESKTTAEFLNLKRDYPPKRIPFIPLAVLLTADIRDAEIHFVIRAWGEFETSAMLLYGVLPRMVRDLPGTEPTGESLRPLDAFMGMTFQGPDGKEYPVQLAGIDAGWKPDEVYAYARKRPYVVAMKAEFNLTETIKFSRPEKVPGTSTTRPDSCHLFAWNHKYYADVLAAKLTYSKDAPGEFMLHAEAGEDYATHMTAEVKKIIRDKWGRPRTVYARRPGSPPNHWLDCEREQVVLCRYLRIGDQRLSTEAKSIQATIKPPASILHRDFSAITGRLRT